MNLSRSTTSGDNRQLPWIRVHSSAIGLFSEFIPSRRGLGQVAFSGQALVDGEITVHLSGHGTLTLRSSRGSGAIELALDLATRLFEETIFDGSVRPRGEGFAVVISSKMLA